MALLIWPHSNTRFIWSISEGRKWLFLGPLLQIFLFLALHLENLFPRCGSTAPLSSMSSCTCCRSILVSHCTITLTPLLEESHWELKAGPGFSPNAIKWRWAIPSTCPEGCPPWVLGGCSGDCAVQLMEWGVAAGLSELSIFRFPQVGTRKQEVSFLFFLSMWVCLAAVSIKPDFIL